MNKSLRAGKSSELIVAGELLRHGLDVYLPCVDDQAIDLLIRNEYEDSVIHYDVQVKSVKGYNRIIGVKKPGDRSNRYILIIHYRHGDKPDEFFYLTKEQIVLHHLADSGLGGFGFQQGRKRTLCSSNACRVGGEN